MSSFRGTPPNPRLNRRALLRGLAGLGVLGPIGLGRPAQAWLDGRSPLPHLVAISLDASGSAGSVELRLPFAATHVALSWRGADDHPVELRWTHPGGGGSWRRLPIWHDSGHPDAGVVVTGLVRPEPRSTGIGLRWLAGPTDLEVILIDAGVTPVAGRRVPVAKRAAPQPEIITRAGWGADEGIRRGPQEFAPVSKLVVHHTVTPNDDPDPAQTVRAIYAFHTKHNGWNDIGYNFLVDQQGRVYEGRWARSYRPGEAPTGEDPQGRG